MKIIKTVDLGTRLVYSDRLVESIKSLFDIDMLGFDFDKNYDNVFYDSNIIFRTSCTSKKNIGNNEKTGYFFLLGSIFDVYSKENVSNVDILTIKDIRDIKSFFKKYGGKNIGMEFLLSDMRYFFGDKIGKWFSDMKWIHEQCIKYDFQFILSSGATNYSGLLSSKVFNAFLTKIDIETKKYWNDLNCWLNDKKSLYWQ